MRRGAPGSPEPLAHAGGPQTYGKRPRPRESHAAACHEGKLVVFGGEIGDCCLADLHVLDMDSLEWRQMVVVSKVRLALCSLGTGQHTPSR